MTALLIALKYIPLVLQAIVAIEQVIGAGKGKAKKDLVLASIQAAAQAGEAADNKTVSVISGLIDNSVTVLNQAGVFTKGQ